MMFLDKMMFLNKMMFLKPNIQSMKSQNKVREMFCCCC